MRSLLFVPGDSPRKLEKGLGSGADCLLIDLEDSVAPDAKPAARELSTSFLRDMASKADEIVKAGRPQLYVRINALDTPYWPADVETVMAGRPDGILLPKARNGADVQTLSVALDKAEQANGLANGAVRILALVSETPVSLLNLNTYPGCSPRLVGLTWGAEDLSAALGASTNRDEHGRYTSPYRLARDLSLFTAAAAEVPAIDTVFTSYRDLEGLRLECAEALRDGFNGKLAIHPAQVPVINEVFTPGEQELERARRIVALFRADPGLGVIGLDGEMLDRPHLIRAERLLARGGSSS